MTRTTTLDPTRPATWPQRVLNMAMQAMRGSYVHRMQANRLIACGLAVDVDGCCTLVEPARAALTALHAANRQEGQSQ